MPKKLPTGYSKKSPNEKDKGKNGKKKKRHILKKNYVASLIIADKNKVGIFERIVKIFIFLALRLVIKPSKWKQPEKNYELIDRVYKRVMGADFAYIPSSIAFYIVMAFMPVISLISLISAIPQLDGIFGTEDIEAVLGKFIPGIDFIIKQISEAFEGNDSTGGHILGISGTLALYTLSVWIAAGGMAKLVFTQSYIYGHKYVGGWWMNRIKGMGMVLGLSILLIIALMINIQIENGINRAGLSETWSEALKYIILIFGLFVLMFVLFIILFKVSPRYKIKVKEVIPGAMVAGFPIAFFLSIFTIFSSNLSYHVYGYISALMYVGLISIWISIFIFLGITTNAAYFRTHVSDKPRFKWTLSKK